MFPPCQPTPLRLTGVSIVYRKGLSMLTQLFAVRLAEYGIGYEVRPGVIKTI